MIDNNKKERIQVTLICESGKYRPISTLVKVNNREEINTRKQEIIKEGILNICHQRYTTWNNLKKDGYTKVKTRVYDLEEIEQQKEQRNKAKQLKEMYEKRLKK